MRKSIDNRKEIIYIRNISTTIANKLRQKGEKNMNDKFITKPILRDSVQYIGPLCKAYSGKLGVSVKQGEAISMAIKNEYKRIVKKG